MSIVYFILYESVMLTHVLASDFNEFERNKFLYNWLWNIFFTLNKGSKIL